MEPRTTDNPAPDRDDELGDATVQAIVDAVHGIRFGQVTVIVQDGHVVQIDRTERRRLKPERT